MYLSINYKYNTLNSLLKSGTKPNNMKDKFKNENIFIYDFIVPHNIIVKKVIDVVDIYELY